MTISPTITISTTPGLAISSGSQLSYAAILNSMGVFVYNVNQLFYQSSTSEQFSNPIQYALYSANGDIASQQIITPLGTNQYQSTTYVDMKKRGVILNAQSGLNFNMNPNSFIRFIFYADRLSNDNFIDMAGGINNFKETEERMQLPGFFGTKNEDE